MKRFILTLTLLFLGLAPASAQFGGCSGGFCTSSVAAASGPAWTPLSLGANLKGWYKGEGYTSGSGWTDQSGGGNNMSGFGYSQPAASTLNGKPSLIFVSQNNQLRTATETVAIGTGNTFSIFMLGSHTSSSTSGPSMGGNGAGVAYGANAQAFTMAVGVSGKLELVYLSGEYGGATVSTGVEQRYGIVYNGTSFQLYLNGAALGSPYTASFSFTSPGTFSAGGNGLDGNVREIVFVNRALTSGEITSMDTYLVGRQ